MRKLDLSYECLSAVLDRRTFLEVVPEPFRLQSNTVFRINYSEYNKYILSLPMDSEVLLSGPIINLQSLASTNSPLLFKFFLRDIAFALCKELWFAVCYSRDASTYLPTSDIEPIDMSTLVSYSDGMTAYVWQLQQSLEQAQILLDPYQLGSVENNNLYRLAVVLNHFSWLDKLVKVNLVC